MVKMKYRILIYKGLFLYILIENMQQNVSMKHKTGCSSKFQCSMDLPRDLNKNHNLNRIYKYPK